MKNKRKYACRIFLCRMFKVFVLFTFALANFCRLSDLNFCPTYGLLGLLANEPQDRLPRFHGSSYIWISWSRKVTQHWESDWGTKSMVRSNTFADYCYIITRHIQDGPLQVTKEATSKSSCHTFTGQKLRIFEFLGKRFSNLEEHFLDRTLPLTKLLCLIPDDSTLTNTRRFYLSTGSVLGSLYW